MTEKRTMIEEIGKRTDYIQAVVVHGGGQPTSVSDTLRQRTVATSLTEGTVALRYAPRTPKASEPVDTSS